MDFREFVLQSKSSIEKRMHEIIDEKEKEFNLKIGAKSDLFESLREYLFGGKMLRGSLFLFSARAFGLRENEELLTIACSLEMMHSALLVHDDIMDSDEMRRGKKTMHAKYRDLGRKTGLKDPKYYGISMGLIIGDIMLFTAEELASYYDKPYLQKLIRFYSQELRTVGIGQLLDYSYGIKNEEIDYKDLEKMYIYKSARYSFSLPLVLGAIAAERGENDIKVLDSLGEKIGLIFQLVDDYIGIFGSEKEIGKPVGSDIRENKKTIMRNMLFDKVDEKTRESLRKIYGKEHVSAREIEMIKQYTVYTGVDNDIKALIDNLSEEANALVDSLTVSNDYKNIYKDLIAYNTKRTF